MVGIEDLHGERLPSARRAAIDEARPALADASELLLDGRNQLRLDRVAVRADIGRVHRIGIVIVRIGVLNFDDEHAREAGADPLLVELVSLLLLDAVVAAEVEAFAVVGLEIGIGRLSAKIVEAVDKVVVKDDQREARVRMVVESFGHKHDGGEIHGPSPELRQQRALNLDVADVFRVRRRWIGGISWSSEMEIDAAAGLDVDLRWLAVKIAGRDVPVLPFALVHVQLDGFAVGR